MIITQLHLLKVMGVPVVCAGWWEMRMVLIPEEWWEVRMVLIPVECARCWEMRMALIPVECAWW